VYLHSNKILFKQFISTLSSRYELNSDFVSAFIQMQEKYLLNEKYRITINELKSVIDVIKRSKSLNI
jgi:hypothetical protein